MKALAMLDHVMLWVARTYAVGLFGLGLFLAWVQREDGGSTFGFGLTAWASVLGLTAFSVVPTTFQFFVAILSIPALFISGYQLLIFVYDAGPDLTWLDVLIPGSFSIFSIIAYATYIRLFLHEPYENRSASRSS